MNSSNAGYEFVVSGYLELVSESGKTSKNSKRTARPYGNFDNGAAALDCVREVVQNTNTRIADMFISVYDNAKPLVKPTRIEGKHLRQIVTGVGENMSGSNVAYITVSNSGNLILHDDGFEPSGNETVVALTYSLDDDLQLESASANTVGITALNRIKANRKSIAYAIELLQS